MMRGAMSKWSEIGALFVIMIGAPALAFAQGDATKGEKQFEDCAACHSVKPGENLVGPSLFGVVNRKAGEVAEFRYSPAMKRSGLVWTAKALDDFIADP